MKKQDDVKKGFELSNLLSGVETFKVRFAFLNLTLKLLTREDVKDAELAGRLPGPSPKRPKQDADKYASALLSRCVIGWEHIDGVPLLNDGKELKCIPKNIVMVADELAGMAQFIFNNCKSADTMYRTLDEQEIKN